jgi:hypothetical protein
MRLSSLFLADAQTVTRLEPEALPLLVFRAGCFRSALARPVRTVFFYGCSGASFRISTYCAAIVDGVIPSNKMR